MFHFIDIPYEKREETGGQMEAGEAIGVFCKDSGAD